MTDQPNATPPPDPLALAAESYGKALIASMTQGRNINFDVMQQAIDTSMALRLGEFIAEKLAPLLALTTPQLQGEFAQYLNEQTERMRGPSWIALAGMGRKR